MTITFSNPASLGAWNPSESEPAKWRQFSDDQLRDLLHKRDSFPLDVLRLTRRAGLIEALESEAA